MDDFKSSKDSTKSGKAEKYKTKNTDQTKEKTKEKLSSKNTDKSPIKGKDVEKLSQPTTQLHQTAAIVNPPEQPTQNIFDLSALVGIQNEHEVKHSTMMTPDEQEKMLRNYTEVDKVTWAAIPIDSHIRYLRKDGAFRRGGFVKNSWVGAYGASTGKKCLQLSATQSYKSTKWTICLDDIEKIWKQSGGVEQSGEKNIISPELTTAVQSNKENVEYLMRSVEQLKIDISKVNNEQTRIINLIKKLHNIKCSSDRK